MTTIFYKYHGSGNDFILIDNRAGIVALNTEQIAHLCHRHMGIGADGLMLLESALDKDFHMVYYNSDGRESTMCGNGGRCMVLFAQHLGIIDTTASFSAIDGVHTASFTKDGLIALKMQDVHDIQYINDSYLLNTGSPHYVSFVHNVHDVNITEEGRTIRNRPDFAPNGINVNFVEVLENSLFVRTYERGVEDETMSCGTGVVAAAIANSCHLTGTFTTHITTLGGHLSVSFTKDSPTTAKDVVLTGPAVRVFEGRIEL